MNFPVESLARYADFILTDMSAAYISVQNVAERRDVHSRFIQGIYAVIDRYIPHRYALGKKTSRYNPQSR